MKHKSVRLEELPKLLDTLDSVFFMLRTRMAGGYGYRLRSVAIWLTLGLPVSVYPPARAAALAALGTYLLAELSYRAAAMPRYISLTGPAAR